MTTRRVQVNSEFVQVGSSGRVPPDDWDEIYGRRVQITTLITASGERRPIKVVLGTESYLWNEYEAPVMNRHAAEPRYIVFPSNYYGPLEGQWEFSKLGDRLCTVYVEDTEAFAKRWLPQAYPTAT